MKPHPIDFVPGMFSAFGLFAFAVGLVMGAGLVGWPSWWRGMLQGLLMIAGVCGLIGGLAWLSMKWK